MARCCIEDCELNAYEENSKCILHCEKTNYSSDFHKTGFLNSFYEELINYIVKEEFSYKKEDPLVNKNSLEDYLKDNIEEGLIGSFSKISIVLTKIVFPERDNRDRFDYLNILKKLEEIHFNYCEFKLYGLDLNKINCFYQDCLFHDRWHIYNSPILGNVNNVLYQSCIFYADVSSCPEGDEKYEIDCQLFNDCEFQKKLEFEKVIFISSIFNNTEIMDLSIGSFKLSGCEIREKIVLNDCKIDDFLLEDTVFKSKVEFKNNVVNNFNIYNTNFLKLVDMYETKFISFSIKKSIFEDFVGFEKCVFGTGSSGGYDFIARFTYATFLSFVNFRNTKFNSGLDIENINLKEPPNFLNIKINPIYSNRETFRIIKNSFDKIGNNIEANKFFAYEMQEYKKELKNTNKNQEKIILFLNEKISNFGQSYIRPIILMIFSSFFYYLLILGYENNFLYKVCTDINWVLEGVSNTLNSISINILPISRFLKNGMEFISLIFYIIFASLIWQILVSVKRHTKR